MVGEGIIIKFLFLGTEKVKMARDPKRKREIRPLIKSQTSLFLFSSGPIEDSEAEKQRL